MVGRSKLDGGLVKVRWWAGQSYMVGRSWLDGGQVKVRWWAGQS